MADPIEPVSLRAGGLLLRPWRPRDGADLQRPGADPHLVGWLTALGIDPAALPDAGRLAELWGAGRAAPWAVTAVSDSSAAPETVLAAVVLSDLDRAFPRLETWVAPSARGRGVAAAASRAACRWAFARGAPKVVGLAEVGDEASWRAGHRVGFSYEGVRRRELAQAGGGWSDAWAGSLLPAALDAAPAGLPYEPLPALVDGDLSLRRWLPADAAAWATLRNDPSVTAWGASRGTESPAGARAAITAPFVEDWMLGRCARLAVEVAGAVVGGVSLTTPHLATHCGEAAWWLAPTARGRGVGTRAVRLLVGWALGPLGLRRLEARVHVDNAPSRALADRVGFTAEGTLRREAPSPAGMGDAVLYGLLAP